MSVIKKYLNIIPSLKKYQLSALILLSLGLTGILSGCTMMSPASQAEIETGAQKVKKN